MFSIGENGDIYLDENTNSMFDQVIGDPAETEFKIARSRIISHFKYRGYLANNFIKHHRNKYKDEEIKRLLDSELNKLFSDNMRTRNKITYIFKNKVDKFFICFIYKKNKLVNRNLLYYSIKV